MVFSSITFMFFFLPVFLIAYFVIRPTGPRILLPCCSLLFYGWGEPWFVLVLLASIVLNALMALVIDAQNGWRRRLLLAATVTANLLLLGVFKYADFVVGNVTAVSRPWAGT